MILTKEQIGEFEKIVRPVMEYLNNPDLFHPHVQIIINGTRAELTEGVAAFITEDYIPTLEDATE